MPFYVLTGAPGAGKTAILRLLEVRGYAVVEEAASDIIALGQALGRAEPWNDDDFIDKVTALQRQRQDRAGESVFFDRSPACTLALSRFLGLPVPRLLSDEVSRMITEGTYERAVFFVRNQGFVQPTTARRISFEDSLVFEQLHEQVYRDLGYELVDVPPGPLASRADAIQHAVSASRTRPAEQDLAHPRVEAMGGSLAACLGPGLGGRHRPRRSRSRTPATKVSPRSRALDLWSRPCTATTFLSRPSYSGYGFDLVPHAVAENTASKECPAIPTSSKSPAVIVKAGGGLRWPGPDSRPRNPLLRSCRFVGIANMAGDDRRPGRAGRRSGRTAE